MYNKENLTKLKKMNALAPQVMKAFWAFDKVAVADGAIPVKYKELIAVAVALTTQCPYASTSILVMRARPAPRRQSWLKPQWWPPHYELEHL